jgi:catechol 2,3-dioxygenase-like lactoylglutathione lyase family enzyme
MIFDATATPVAFLNVGDRERALAFYEGVLGLALKSSDGFGDFIELGGEGLLRMTVMADHKASGHPVLGWNVADIAAAVATLSGRGVTIIRYEGMGLDAAGIWTGPDGTKVAFFGDPDGNVLTLSQAV